jgi:hypothetical protein
MVATTKVRFLVGANYGVDLKKNPLAGETGVRGFSKPGEGFLFLMKTVGRSYPHRLGFFLYIQMSYYLQTVSAAQLRQFALLKFRYFTGSLSCYI